MPTLLFDNLRKLLERIGFEERIRGSHHTFRKDGVVEKINLQSDGSKAKVYQVRTGAVGAIKIQTGRRTMTHKYEVIIYRSNEDEVYVAEIPELPGCMAHGDSHESALANANEAIHSGLTLLKSSVIPFQSQRVSG